MTKWIWTRSGETSFEEAADLGAEALADLVDIALGRDGDVERVAFLGHETGRREPGVILRPINDLLDAGEDLAPGAHVGDDGRYLIENPQLFHSCGNSGSVDGRRSLAQRSGVAKGRSLPHGSAVE